MVSMKHEFQIEVRAIPVPDDEMTEMIIRALFGCSPAEAAKICLDEMRALNESDKEVTA